jgi:hypothetical protein
MGLHATAVTYLQNGPDFNVPTQKGNSNTAVRCAVEILASKFATKFRR